MKGKISFAVLLLCLCLVGCSAKEAEKKASEVKKDWSEKTTFFMSASGCETENGVILNGGDLYLYYDEGSGILTPLCSRADCDHTSTETCTAYLLMEQSTGVIGYYEGYLWFFGWDDGIVTLRRANADGSDMEELFQVDVGLTPMESCIYGGVLYMVDERFDIKESSINPEDITYRMVAIELETGDMKVILEETPELPRLAGVAGNKFYYIAYQKEQEKRVGTVYCYNCDTGEKTKVPVREGNPGYARIGEGYLAYLIYEGEEWDWYIMDPETGEELASVMGRGKDVSQRAFSNQFLLEYLDECYRFDAKSRTEEYFSNQAIKDYFLVWAVEGGYLVKLVENNHITDEFAFISEENLQNGGEVELLEW